MTPHFASQKPKNVTYAEWVLWAWTAWTCVYGMYQAWAGIPAFQDTLATQFQGMISVTPQEIIGGAAVGYLVLGGICAWIVLAIGRGKRWARSSVLWGVGLEVLLLLFPPYGGFEKYFTAFIDVALQGGAVYLLYTWPGRTWFPENKLVKD